MESEAVVTLINRLCAYFNMQPGDLFTYVEDRETWSKE